MNSLSGTSLLNMQASSIQALQTSSTPRKRKSGFESVHPKRNKHSNSEISSDMSVQHVGRQRRTSSRKADRSSCASQAGSTEAAPEGATTERSPIKIIDFTSPSTNSQSQVSGSSQILDTPSTAPSSVMLDEGVDATSPTAGLRSSNIKPVQLEQTYNERPRSRSSSIGSMDTVTRSSGRNRRPTTKAQALADAGTKFYKTLRRSIDSLEREEEIEHDRTSPSATAIEPATLSIITRVERSEPDELIVTSVEPASVRTSPRQRKPTAKAAAAAVGEPGVVVPKRTMSPADSVRSVKSLKVSSAVPDKPSKLRYSISSDENDEETQTKTETTTITATTDTQDLHQHEICNLNCLSPSSRLLAFARFAADELDTDDEEDDDSNLADLLAAAVLEENKTYDSLTRIAKDHCTCVTEGPHGMPKQAAARSIPNAADNANTPKQTKNMKRANTVTKESINKKSNADPPINKSRHDTTQRDSATASHDGTSNADDTGHDGHGESLAGPERPRRTRASLRNSLPLGKSSFERKMQEDYLAAQTDEGLRTVSGSVTAARKRVNEYKPLFQAHQPAQSPSAEASNHKRKTGLLVHAHEPIKHSSTVNGESDVVTAQSKTSMDDSVIEILGKEPKGTYKGQEDAKVYKIRHAIPKSARASERSETMMSFGNTGLEAQPNGKVKEADHNFLEPLKVPSTASGRTQAQELNSPTKTTRDPLASDAELADASQPNTYTVQYENPPGLKLDPIQPVEEPTTKAHTRHRRSTQPSNRRSPRPSRSTMNGPAKASSSSSPTTQSVRPSKKIILRFTPVPKQQ